jgi:hypothetical protein
MNPHVKYIKALEDYELEAVFDNGESRRFDVKPYLDRGIFVRLRDQDAFRAVRVVADSVEWANGLDLSYDTLYVEGKPNPATTPKAELNDPADARQRRMPQSTKVILKAFPPPHSVLRSFPLRSTP